MLIAVVMLLCSAVASAYDFQVDSIYYYVNGDEVAVTFMKRRNGGYSGNVVIPDSVTYNEKTYSVTSIGKEAFFRCSGLTSITIPNCVTSIGGYAFEGCSGLTSITIPNSVTSIGSSAFYNCSGLTSVTIGNSVTSIGNKAFYNCTNLIKVINFSNLVFELWSSNNGYIAYYADEVINAHNGSIEGDFIFGIIDGVNTLQYYLGNDTEITLPNNYKGENYVIGDNVFYRAGLTSIVIPNSVTSIGEGAFSGCSGLTSVTIPNSVTSIGHHAFSYCSGLTSVTIPNSVTSIGDYAFSYCSSLTSVTIPNNVTSIGNYAFSGCSGLTSIVIPNSVTSIGGYAFADCAGLTSITIPENVTSIEEGTFRYCSGLTSITIPESVTEIGWSAFYGCTGLTSIIVEEGNSVYDSRDNCNAIIETATNTLVQGCNNTVIPESVTSIGVLAFYNCTRLTSIIIPESVTSIGGGAFSGCSGLTSIIVDKENSVYDSRDNCNAIIETATNWLIKGCKNTIIPNSVTSIVSSAFNNCTGLTSIEIPNSVTSIGSYAFDGCSGLTSITIPSSVKYIGGDAFYGCTSLTSIYLFSETPATIYVLDRDNNIYENATLYVPQGSLEAYKAADGWKEFKNIVEFDPTAIEDVTEEDAPAFEITAGGIKFTDAEGKTVAVYTTAGALVEKIDSYAGEEITLDKGVYIICVGDKALKVKL